MKYLLTIIGVLVVIVLNAQVKFNINGQYMNRAEYRHGFSTLAAPDQDAAFFISQRARLMSSVKIDKAEFYLSIQDVRTWGSTANGTVDNAGLLSVHEAWAALQLSNKFNLKMGRQEIAYDEDRIFGSLDWAMQARRHDAALLKYYDSASNTALHVGFAFNQDKEQLAGTTYTVANNYKTFQYLYFSHPFGKIKASFLFLNNGIQFAKPNTTPTEYKTVFTQTFGPRVAFKEKDKNLFWNAALYYQMGTNNQDRSVSAYDALAEVGYQITKSFSLTAGGELLSGTDEIGGDADESQSFSPFYGTNHRFNGYMDYFYVGNHFNTVGLNDYYLKAQISRPQVFYALAIHSLHANAIVKDDDAVSTEEASKNFGTELDFTVNYNFAPGISLQGGYSQFFAKQALEYIKDISDGSKETNNWAYFMVILRPGVAWPRTGLKL